MTILDEEMMDAIDEELEAMVAERVAEAKGKSEDDDKDGDDGDDDDKDGDDKDGDDDDEEKTPVKKESTKESFLESLIDGPAPEAVEKAGKTSFLESLTN